MRYTKGPYYFLSAEKKICKIYKIVKFIINNPISVLREDGVS